LIGTFVETVWLVAVVPAGVAISETFSTSYTSVRRHLALFVLDVLNHSPTAGWSKWHT